ncbi:MAG: RNA methyltransferase [Oligoflexia bacterium]|nr:RNA methyltransferase [Oligoflexia bacterium]
MKPNIYVGLLHHSMRDKNGELVTTAVTNLDVHDIARSSRTYGISKYFLINPIKDQQDVVTRIIGHWNGPGGMNYNPDRSEAFGRVLLVSWLDDALQKIRELEGVEPDLWMTSAKTCDGVHSLTWGDARAELEKSDAKPKMIVFGTGWGISEELLRKSTALLTPIVPEEDSGYNHLSVRSAVAISLDRLLGQR